MKMLFPYHGLLTNFEIQFFYHNFILAHKHYLSFETMDCMIIKKELKQRRFEEFMNING